MEKKVNICWHVVSGSFVPVPGGVQLARHVFEIIFEAERRLATWTPLLASSSVLSSVFLLYRFDDLSFIDAYGRFTII